MKSGCPLVLCEDETGSDGAIDSGSCPAGESKEGPMERASETKK